MKKKWLAIGTVLLIASILPTISSKVCEAFKIS